MVGVGAARGTWPFACRAAEVAAIESVRPAGAVIVAGAGVGKTRLLGELAGRCDDPGQRVIRVTGSRSLTAIPLGVFAGALDAPLGDGLARFEVFQGALGQLMADAPPTDVVVVVDDAHLLDDASAGLVQLAAQSGARVLAAVRRGEPCPEPITALWKDELAIRVDLAPLERDDVGEMLRIALGGPVDSRSRQRLWEVTRGNVLFLRELVRSALVEGTLTEHSNVWRWNGSPSEAPGVRDLVLARLAMLGEPARELAESLAVGEPLSPTVIARLHPSEALEEAERAGMVEVATIGLRREARLAHPVYSDVVRGQLGAQRLAVCSARLAEALVATGMRRHGDALRVAALQLDAGVAIERSLLRSAVRQAQQIADLPLLERLARSARANTGDIEATLVLGEVLYWGQRYEELIDVIDVSVLEGAAPERVAHGARLVADAWFTGLGRLAEAEYWLAWGIEHAGRPYELELRGAYAQMLMFAGRAIESLEVGRSVLDDPDASAMARLRAYSGTLSSAAICGRFAEVDAGVTRAFEIIATAGLDAAFSAGGVMVGSFISRMFGGGLREIDPVFAAMYDASVQRVDDPFRGAWAFLLGRSKLAQGLLTEAQSFLREATATLRERDPGAMFPWALAALAEVLGQMDDAGGAAAAVKELDEVRVPGMHHIDLDIELGRAWAAAARGERSIARDVALALAQSLEADGKLAIAALAFHDALRLGADPSAVAAELAAIAGETDSVVIDAMAMHAEGLAASDLDRVLEAASAFEASGSVLYAAEAFAGASRLAADAGLRVRQRDASVRSAELVRRCGAALTPMLETAVGRAALESLTRREQEVALMAGRGLSKREIASLLHLSVRTVGNHINHVYGKLGISSREELRVLVGADDGVSLEG
jgi:DNA-binding CsgD family transcriptional regulator